MTKTPLPPKNGWNTAEARKITKIPLKPKKRLQYPQILKDTKIGGNIIYYSEKMIEIPLRLKEGQPTQQTQKMAETPLLPKKLLKYPQSKKNNWNTIEAYK